MKFLKHAAAGSVLGLVSSAFSTCALAQSSIEFGGMIDTYAGSIERAGDKGRTAGVNSGGMQTSWWGFRGTEELGGGLKAHFALTGFFRPDIGGMGRNSTDTQFSRDANVGISGSFGRISLGRDLAPNFVPMLTFNPFGSSFQFSPLGLHANTSSSSYRGQSWSPTVAGDTGWSNEIMYVTPKLGNFTTSLFLQLGEQAGTNGKYNFGVNTMYSNGPLGFGAYYQSVEVMNPVDTTEGDSRVSSFTPYNSVTGETYSMGVARNEAWFVGSSYDLKYMKLFGTLSFTKNKLLLDADDDRYDLKSNTVQIGTSVPVGSGSVLFSWARTKVKASGDFSDVLGSDVTSSIVRNTASLGYDYFLSKRTDLYTVASYDKLTDRSSGTSFGVGIRHRF